ncbi:hypothetical protein ACHAXR_005021, partial [Thalassiosira sp. AJA248-18]
MAPNQPSLDSRKFSRRANGISTYRSGGWTLDWKRDAPRRDPSGHEVDLTLARAESSKVRSYVREMSSFVADPVELGTDIRRLRNSVREIGEQCPRGVDAVAVWVLDEDTGKLTNPAGGWWRRDLGIISRTQAEALARLEDKTRRDYVKPSPVSPGTDIAGILWAESRNRDGGSDQLAHGHHHFHLGRLSPHSNQQHTYGQTQWRNINSICDDPDSATGPRPMLLKEAGFKMAAGIPFQVDMQHSGLVVFFTTVKDRHDERLARPTSGVFLHYAAQHIASTMALADIRRAALAETHQLKEKCYSISASSRKNDDAAKGKKKKDPDYEAMMERSHRRGYFQGLFKWAKKLKGGSMPVPPSMSWKQSLWTVIGSFVGLITLSALNQGLQLATDDEYALMLGPFGALCTLMYGLTAAPASQPRNVVLGQVIAGAISLAFTYIPKELMPIWVRIAVGPAFAIGAMAKAGVTHPPAGAASVLLASGNHNFGVYGWMVLASALSVIPATLVNNMSSKRQYPIYWGKMVPSKLLEGLRQYFRSGEEGGHSQNKPPLPFALSLTIHGRSDDTSNSGMANKGAQS